VVAEGGLELHTCRQQFGVRLFELLHEVLRRLAPVHVVAEHDDEVVREAGVKCDHLRADVVLRRIARAVVADGRELQGSRLVRKR
jgi:hypothetical protein